MINGQTFFTRFASSSPLVIADETVYQVTDRKATANRGQLQLGNSQLYLAAGPSLSTLEQFERQRFRQEILAFQKQYVEQALKEELFSKQEASDLYTHRRTIEFILLEVLPQMIDTAYELGELMGVQFDGSQTGRKVMEDIIAAEEARLKDPSLAQKTPQQQVQEARESLLARLNQQQQEPFFKNWQPHPQPRSLFSQLTDSLLLYVLEGFVFQLEPKEKEKEKKNKGMVVHYDKKEYHPQRIALVSDVEAVYHRILLQQFRKEALETLAAPSDLTPLVKQKEVLDLFAEREEFRYGNLGYVRKGENFFVFWETPQFAMQNPLKPTEYHPFPKSRIGVRINYSDERFFQGEACIIDPMVHPFLRQWDAGYQKICILNFNPFSNDAYGIVRHLSTAVNAFTNGLTMESLKRHGTLDETAPYFGQPLKDSLDHAGRISRAEALQRGYKITNEWDLEGREL